MASADSSLGHAAFGVRAAGVCTIIAAVHGSVAKQRAVLDLLPTSAAERAFLIREELVKGDALASYCGPMNDDLLAGMGSVLRDNLARLGVDPRVARAVFSILVEQVQNVMRYSQEPMQHPDYLREGLVQVGRTGRGGLYVSCSNLVDDAVVPELRATIGRLRGLDRRVLTALMGDVLFDGEREESRGAGVGWITIAREATGGFEFDFYPIMGTDKSYFTFKAYFK